MDEGGPTGPGKPAEMVSFEKLSRSQYLRDLRNAHKDLSDFANAISVHLEEVNKLNDAELISAHVRALSNQIVVFAGDHREAAGAEDIFNKTGDILRSAQQFIDAGAVEPAKQAVMTAASVLVEGLAKTYFSQK